MSGVGVDLPAGITYCIGGTSTTPFVYVTDTANNRIEVWDWYGVFQFTIGPAITGLTGNLNRPYGIDNDGQYIYITDTSNSRVVKLDLYGNFVATWGSEGDTLGHFNDPMGICVDNRFVYVVDSGNNRYQVFDKVGNPIFMLGSFGSGTDQFNAPTDITQDTTYIYIYDSGNFRTVYYLKNQSFPSTLMSPGTTFEIQGTYNFLSMEFMSPGSTLTMEGTYNPLSQIQLKSPGSALSIQGIYNPTGQISFISPGSTLAIRGITGHVSEIAFISPGSTLSIQGLYHPISEISFTSPGSTLLMYGNLIRTDLNYTGVVMNTFNGAHTELIGWDYNSVVDFNGHRYMVNHVGLYKETPGSDVVPFYFRIGQFDSWKGSESLPPSEKRDLELFLSYWADGEMELVMEGDRDGKFCYAIDDSRRKLGKGWKSRFYELEFKNKTCKVMNMQNGRLLAISTMRTR